MTATNNPQVTVFVPGESGTIDELCRYRGTPPSIGDEIGLMDGGEIHYLKVRRVRRGVHALCIETTVEVWCDPVDRDGELVDLWEFYGRAGL